MAQGRDQLRSAPATAAARLTACLALWRGRALADVAEEPFARAEAERLEERRQLAVEERVEADLALARHSDLVGELETLLTEHPLRERLCGQLMLALYRSGRQAEASAVFHRTREQLVDELGMEPGPDLQRLFKQILTQDPALGGPPSAPEPSSPRTNLPHPLSRLVGREVETVGRLISRSRLTTLTGPGGIGKTRLALETAARVSSNYPDGVWLVELAPIADPKSVPHVVLSTLGLRRHSGLTELGSMVSPLRTGRCLLLLDNCEHLIEASAALAETLLEGCPELRVLATSRELLGVAGETTWRVPSLDVPSPDTTITAEQLMGFGAVQLFMELAAAAGRGFELDDETTPEVARICHQLDGIPLAIELAAARLRMMPVAGIDERLVGRFDLLGDGRRRSLPRQRTLEATLDWSHELLTPGERTSFAGWGSSPGDSASPRRRRSAEVGAWPPRGRCST